MTDPACPYVSRGGVKLAAALDHFGVAVAGRVCADLGCNVGGFTDCLLQRGAARVFAVDTGYGTLAWKLRQDPRVVVLERTNAVHFDPLNPPPQIRNQKSEIGNPLAFLGCDLVVIDLGWTRQAHALPAALRWLRPVPQLETRNLPGAKLETPPPPQIITLIKPHYEAPRAPGRGGAKGGVLDDAAAEAAFRGVLAELPALGVRVRGHLRSPIRGGASRGIAGNIEYLALLEPI